MSPTLDLQSTLRAAGLLSTKKRDDADDGEISNANVQWLQQEITNGAGLTKGIPGTPDAAFQRWMGSRLVWWPQGIPSGRRIGLASSRLGRKLESREAWFTVLRAACGKVDMNSELLVSAVETTSADFVERAASLFGRRLLRIEVADDEQSINAWLKKLRRNIASTEPANVYSAFISPSLPISKNKQVIPKKIIATPARDRALIAFSDQLLVSHLRSGGHWHELVRARLADRAWPLATVHVAVGDSLISKKIVEELMGLGVVGWYLFGNPPPSDLAANSNTESTQKNTPQRIISVPPQKDWLYLTHCTRSRDGAWPDETADDFLDSLILATNNNSRSAFAALARIVQQQRLVASSSTIRGGHKMVAFTAVPLTDLGRLRKFRAHRGRWDFEPYGYCIRRDWLEKLACQPVIYGNDDTWKNLKQEQHPFFQKATSGRGKTAIDWTVEREWRHAGDIDLSSLPESAAFVFVPTQEEAEKIAEISRWPVVVLAAMEG